MSDKYTNEDFEKYRKDNEELINDLIDNTEVVDHEVVITPTKFPEGITAESIRKHWEFIANLRPATCFAVTDMLLEDFSGNKNLINIANFKVVANGVELFRGTSECSMRTGEVYRSKRGCSTVAFPYNVFTIEDTLNYLTPYSEYEFLSDYAKNETEKAFSCIDEVSTTKVQPSQYYGIEGPF